MARVTVEDCVRRVQNRFDLVLLAAQRTRQLSAGAPLTIDRGNDKNPVVALREIAEGTVSLPELERHLVEALQKHVVGDEPEEEYLELLSEEQAFAGETQHQLEIQELSLDDELDDSEIELDLAVDAVEEPEE